MLVQIEVFKLFEFQNQELDSLHKQNQHISNTSTENKTKIVSVISRRETISVDLTLFALLQSFTLFKNPYTHVYVCDSGARMKHIQQKELAIKKITFRLHILMITVQYSTRTRNLCF